MRIRKAFLPAVLLVLLSLPVFAEDGFDLDELGKSVIPYVQLDLMCSFDSFLEPEENEIMQTYSSEIAVYYKELLYDRYSQDPYGTAAINVFTGGLGSLINGNVLTGTILQTGMIASYTMMVLSLVEQDPAIKKAEMIGAEIGAAIFGIAGVVLPFIEISAYNKALKKSLNM